ncbi:uncharacterized protein LOC135197996 [Macrobrachium nipponense]|uniref:uncharacterized protein LOC135197996 n=1 Tax=Macrobrachium nipponense TaxID=159736 RepID=UPI0030C8A564
MPIVLRIADDDNGERREFKMQLWEEHEMGKPVKARRKKKEEDEANKVYSHWNLLPDLLLEKVFQYLSLSQRYIASMVCRRWYEAFSFPRVWYTFVLHDELLTKRKFNICSGWQKLLDHIRTSHFVGLKGKNIRTLIFPPMNNLFNLYEFLNITHYINHRNPGTLDNVHTLRFTFACQVVERREEHVFGTGGQILAMFKKVLGDLINLRTLELRDLLLDGCEGLPLLDEVCIVCCETLRCLVLVNLTRQAHTLLHPGAFVNLQTLVISPQNIGEDLLELIGTSQVRNLYIVQNKYTEHGKSLSYKAWKKCRMNNNRLRVHLCTEGNFKKEIIWQERAPVKSIVYDSPYARVVREKISTSTVLLLAFTAKNLHYFYVRRNAVILKADWPKNPEWSLEFYTWLCKGSRSYDILEEEVSQILGYKWQMLTDKQFKMLKLDLNKTHFMFT